MGERVTSTANLAATLQKHRQKIMTQWVEQVAAGSTSLRGRLPREELVRQATECLDVVVAAINADEACDLASASWAPARNFLDELSRQRVLAGYSSDETATFVFSLKRPVFNVLREEHSKDAGALATELWAATELIDKLGLHTIKAFQATREEVIGRQQTELLELSTPVVKLWDGILALPMIGTLDSSRTQVVMESLLQKIVETESQIAIIDITGVPTVDTLVAQHLLKTVTALRLMGAECIISGVRPQIAQTIVHLGVDLQGVITKANLADALALALKRTGVSVSKQ
jgi:rsbT co-antagonist protein RsbR